MNRKYSSEKRGMTEMDSVAQGVLDDKDDREGSFAGTPGKLVILWVAKTVFQSEQKPQGRKIFVLNTLTPAVGLSVEVRH